MTGGAVVMLIFGCLVLYGGLFVTISKAVKSNREKGKSGN